MLHVCGHRGSFADPAADGLTGLEHPLPLGLLELTGGILRLSGTRGGLRAGGGTMGWGGVCVHCQTAAVLEGSGLPHEGLSVGKGSAGGSIGGIGCSHKPLGAVKKFAAFPYGGQKWLPAFRHRRITKFLANTVQSLKRGGTVFYYRKI